MYYTDDVIEQSTEQKLLWHLLPLLCLLSMAVTLNRLSLGYAAPSLGQQLDIGATQLRIADTLFCAGFVLASLPAAWLLLRFGAKVWITGMMLATALFAFAHALVWNAPSLYAAHLLLGVSEAGLLPAMVYYLAQWMPERHRAQGNRRADRLRRRGAPGGRPWLRPSLAARTMVRRRRLAIPVRCRGRADAVVRLDGTRAIAAGTRRRNLAAALGAHLAGRPPSPEPAPGASSRFADSLSGASTWKLAAIAGIVGLVSGSLGLWVPLAMQETGYVPPGLGTGIMIAAAAAGAIAAVVAGLRWHSRTQCRRALAVGLALAGGCLAMAAVLPVGIAGVLLLAIVAVLAPPILALSWVLAPCILAGPAAPAGFAVVGAAWMLGYFAAAWLAALLSEAGLRCAILAVACLVVAWLARGLDGRHPAELAASPASPRV